MLKTIIFKRPILLNRIQYRSILNITKRHLSDESSISANRSINLKEDVSIHPMEKTDLKMAMQWAREEGWNPGRHEEEALYAADPSGYFMLRVKGIPAASLSAVKYSDKYAFLGLFIVPEQFRGKGYGAMLWDAVLGNIKIFPSIGLSGVLAQVNRYQNAGFQPTFINSRWSGDAHHFFNKNIKPSNNISLSDKYSLQKLIAYDCKIFSSPRAGFLDKWLKMPESHTLVALNANGDIAGYGVISRTEKGYKIAPLFADDNLIAEQLYRGLSSFVGKNSSLHIDICENNTFATKLLAEEFRLKKISNTLQMFRGKLPETEHEKVFGLTSLEIG